MSDLTQASNGKWKIVGIKHDQPGISVPAEYTYKGLKKTFNITASEKTIVTDWETPLGEAIILDEITRVYTAVTLDNKKYVVKPGTEQFTVHPAQSTTTYKLEIEPATLSLSVGSTQQLTAWLTTYIDGVQQGERQNVTSSVIWSSNNSNIVTVNAGLVTAHAEGNGSITATSNGKTVTVNVSVAAGPVFDFGVTRIVFCELGTEAQTISVASNTGWTLTSSEPNWVRFVSGNTGNGNGTFKIKVDPWDDTTAHNTRTATITGTYGNNQTKTLTIVQEVSQKVTTLTVTMPKDSVEYNETVQATATFQLVRNYDGSDHWEPSQNVTNDCTWSSTNSAAATVSTAHGTKGLVTGKNAEAIPKTAKIRAIYEYESTDVVGEKQISAAAYEKTDVKITVYTRFRQKNDGTWEHVAWFDTDSSAFKEEYAEQLNSLSDDFYATLSYGGGSGGTGEIINTNAKIRCFTATTGASDDVMETEVGYLPRRRVQFGFVCNNSTANEKYNFIVCGKTAYSVYSEEGEWFYAGPQNLDEVGEILAKELYGGNPNAAQISAAKGMFSQFEFRIGYGTMKEGVDPIAALDSANGFGAIGRRSYPNKDNSEWLNAGEYVDTVIMSPFAIEEEVRKIKKKQNQRLVIGQRRNGFYGDSGSQHVLPRIPKAGTSNGYNRGMEILDPNGIDVSGYFNKIRRNVPDNDSDYYFFLIEKPCADLPIGTYTLRLKGDYQMNVSASQEKNDGWDIEGWDEQCDESLEVSISPNDRHFHATGETATLTIASNTSWSIDIPQQYNWINISDRNGTGNATCDVEIEPNFSYSQRQGRFTVMTGTENGLEVVINIDQDGADVDGLQNELELGTDDMSLGVGDTKSIVATYRRRINNEWFSQDVTATAEWESDDSQVATVAGGNVTGHAIGVAKVTAKLGDLKSKNTTHVTVS